MTTYTIIRLGAVLLTGLAAGLFYGYDCSVIKGLGNLPAKQYIQTFQAINRAILNPYFFISFIGALLLLPVAAWMGYHQQPGMPFYFLLAAAIVYVIGVFGVTALGNVPLNNALDQFDATGAAAGAVETARQEFEASWNRLHHVRTCAAILSFALSIFSLIKKV